MRRFSTPIAIALSTLQFVCLCGAQQTSTTAIPNLIRYSGTLKDARDTALASSTSVGVTFAIYKQPEGGAPVWQETQNVTPDSNGQYSVILGVTTTIGLPDDLFSQQEQRWLGAQVQGEGEQARVLLVSVPYAFKAHEAETLGGLPASAFVKAPPTDAPGSTSTETGSAVNGVAAAGNAASASKGKGADGKLPPACNPIPGYITYWDNTSTLCATKLFWDDVNQRLGIGITNPSEPLDVLGQISSYQWYDINEERIASVHTNAAVSAPSSSNNLFLGWLAGGNTNSGQNNGGSNTFTGFSAGFNNNSPSALLGDNTYNGTNAGFSNKVGISNTMVGSNAGYANTDRHNTCVGSLACQMHKTGSGNTLVGNSVALSDTAGQSNSCFGDSACYYNKGNLNTIAGFYAGFNNGNTSGNSSGNAIFGSYAGHDNNPAEDGNSFFGYEAGLKNTTGDHNTFIGYEAGMNNTTSTFGIDNTFVGYKAGISNTVSQGNTFVGARAGQATGASNGVECCNTYIGKNSGMTATVSNNTFLGYRTGEVTTFGHDNTFVGLRSGVVNTLGNTNSFFGTITGEKNTTGSYNTFLGEEAGHENLDGSFNTYVGFQAGNGVIGHLSSNIEIGNNGSANDANTIRIGTHGSTGLGNGEQNIVFVDPILWYPTSGPPYPDVVTIDAPSGKLGHAKFPTGGGGGIGPCSMGMNYLTKWTSTTMVDCSHVWEDTNSPWRVGIGTTTPAEQLDIRGEINAGDPTLPTKQHYRIIDEVVLSIDGTNNLFAGAGACTANTGNGATCVGQGAGGNKNAGNNNTFVGSFAGNVNTGGRDNTFVGASAGSSNLGTAAPQGTGNIFIGQAAGSNNKDGSDDIYIGNKGPVSDEDKTIRLGNPSVQLAAYAAGIWMGSTGVPNFKVVCVDINGKLWGAAFNTDCTSSSRRFKEQINDMGDSSGKLFQLRPVTFFYKPQYDDGSHLLQYGLIAEELAKVYPDMVAYDKDGQPYTVRYQLLAPMLLNELQKQHTVVTAQQDLIKTQQEQMQTQEQQIQNLQQRLSRLETLLDTSVRGGAQ